MRVALHRGRCGPLGGPIPVAVLLCLLLLSPPRLWCQTGELLLQIDDDGGALLRLTREIGPTRWLWLARGDVVLREEVPAAGGYSREYRRLRPPVSGVDHVVGAEAGPLVVGPLEPRGVYRRALDPTGGGLQWSALTAAPAVRLDRSVDSGRWTGIALRPRAAFGREGRVGVAPGVMIARDDDVELRMAVLPLRAGAVGVALSAVEGRFPPRSADDWLFAAPPLRGDSLRQWGGELTVRGTLTTAGMGATDGAPTTGGAPTTVDAAGGAGVWTQRAGYRPPRRGGQLWASAETEVLTLRGRALAVDPGSRTPDGGRPASATLLAAGLESGRRARRLTWRAEWERRRGWDGERPGPLSEECGASLRWAPPAAWVGLLSVAASTRTADESSVDTALRLDRRRRRRVTSLGATGALAWPRGGGALWRTALPWWHEPTLRTGVTLTVRGDLGSYRRRASVSLGWGSAWSGSGTGGSAAAATADSPQEASLSLSLPVAAWGRVEGRAVVPLSGLARFAGTARGGAAPTPAAADAGVTGYLRLRVTDRE